MNWKFEANGIEGALESAGVIADDHYGIVASHDGSRCFVDKYDPRTEIYITKIQDDEQIQIFGEASK